MRLLLDTHAFIWWDSEPVKLSAATLAACSDPAHELILSVASLWEMQIKQQLGKLTLRLPLPAIVAQQQSANGVRLLPVTEAHVFALDGLPSAHRDPFDRLLVAQAICEGATLVTGDPIFAGYPAPVLW